jgi:predicted secreted protein
MLPGIALLSHCLANQNAKVGEYAILPGVVSPIVSLLQRHGYILQQMPCPEMCALGTRRWWQVRDQYDTPGYRRHCRLLANSVVDVLAPRLAEGPRDVILLGIDGSPSSGVNLTSVGAEWGGKPELPDWEMVAGRGVWIEELDAVVRERGLAPPRMIGVGMELPGYSIDDTLAELERFIASATDGAGV